jgi:hypothetical protein
MRKTSIAVLLACFFLMGSVIFPLCDFSMMKELPGMYHSYTKNAVEEADVVDFVDYYILNEKDFLGTTNTAPSI